MTKPTFPSAANEDQQVSQDIPTLAETDERKARQSTALHLDEKYLFVSFATDDIGDARDIVSYLRQAKLNVWFAPDEVRTADAWERQVVDARPKKYVESFERRGRSARTAPPLDKKNYCGPR